ncbi:hypothetical protein [Nocardioides sp.]|jgi:hypothetical protein|uniref:hypothetical protein n=1 Tax=Nocardioides sp. TaxID=35761 RepID=UPI002D058A3D|nr:hypothetical protein [Nocardioides sp.]HVX54876.1 hypothetical protein [Nocardioides sp.]
MNALGHDVRFTLEAIWKVLLVSVILGAGLPAIFALGIRSLAWGTPAEGSARHDGTAAMGASSAAGRVVAGMLFLVVLYCVAAAIVFIIATGKGDDISFAHVIPTIKTKG